MGVTVTENIDLNNGMSVESYYASINTNKIRYDKTFIPKTTTATDPDTGTVTNVTTPITVFYVSATLNVWVSKEARDANKQSIKSDNVSISQEETPFNGNLYELLYAKYKEDHPTAVDA